MKSRKSQLLDKLQLLQGTGADTDKLRDVERQLQAIEKEFYSYELSLAFEDKMQVIQIEGYRNAIMIYEMYRSLSRELSISFLLLMDQNGNKVRSKLN